MPTFDLPYGPALAPFNGSSGRVDGTEPRSDAAAPVYSQCRSQFALKRGLSVLCRQSCQTG
jgi:hypothetical protein